MVRRKSKTSKRTGSRVEKIMMTKVREGHHLSRHEREVDAITQHILHEKKRRKKRR